MSRVFWDSMLFIYLLEDHPLYAARVQELLDRAYTRGDALFTSHLAVGEVMAGAEKSVSRHKSLEIRDTIEEMGFSCLPFDGGAVGPFSTLRARERLKIADAAHFACAASAGMDLFLTGDKQLTKLNISGIQFIADFNNPIL